STPRWQSTPRPTRGWGRDRQNHCPLIASEGPAFNITDSLRLAPAPRRESLAQRVSGVRSGKQGSGDDEPEPENSLRHALIGPAPYRYPGMLERGRQGLPFRAQRIDAGQYDGGGRHPGKVVARGQGDAAVGEA